MPQIQRTRGGIRLRSAASFTREAKLVLLSGLLVITQGCMGHGGVQSQPRIDREEPHSYVPPAGFVPNATAAVQIAEAVLVPIYGLEQIQRQRPFSAELRADVWVVNGSIAPGTAGGVALVEMSRIDGRILRVSHGR